MATFRKQEDCPSSHQLLSYQRGDLTLQDGRAVGKHLSACEFCYAEVEFYERYPVTDEVDDAPSKIAIPAPLFELAESILNRDRGSRSVAKMFEDIDSAVEGRTKT